MEKKSFIVTIEIPTEAWDWLAEKAEGYYSCEMVDFLGGLLVSGLQDELTHNHPATKVTDRSDINFGVEERE